MGQQQLLLLVLGIVIVGLAVVVGIQAFGENQNKANADALVNDGVRIASDIQAWALKPQAFGGPSSSGDFSTVDFAALGYQATTGTYANLNGDFTLNVVSGTCVIIRGDGTGKTAADNQVYVKVSGTTPESISTDVNPSSAPTSCT